MVTIHKTDGEKSTRKQAPGLRTVCQGVRERSWKGSELRKVIGLGKESLRGLVGKRLGEESGADGLSAKRAASPGH